MEKSNGLLDQANLLAIELEEMCGAVKGEVYHSAETQQFYIELVKARLECMKLLANAQYLDNMKQMQAGASGYSGAQPAAKTMN